jgi:predicted nucleotidyltransferase
MDWFAKRLADIDGVVAVALGGSRAEGSWRPDSDWDFGIYYRGTIDPDAIRALGYLGTVVAPGEWAYPMNGGAWLTVEGERVDVLYRDLDDVERHLDDVQSGDWDLYRVPGYLCGMPSYVLVAELALGRVLHGTLPQPSFPEPLRRRASVRWRYERDFAIGIAGAHARRSDVAGCLGKLSFAILAEAHARLCERGEWICNEKGLVRRAGLADLEHRLTDVDDSSLEAVVAAVRSSVGV